MEMEFKKKATQEVEITQFTQKIWMLTTTNVESRAHAFLCSADINHGFKYVADFCTIYAFRNRRLQRNSEESCNQPSSLNK